jgi:hypothetical protein
MRLVAPDHSEEHVYAAIEEAIDRITLWKAPDDQWWCVVRTDGEHVGVGVVDCAFVLDKSERTDAAIIRFAEKAKARGAHPEDELDS